MSKTNIDNIIEELSKSTKQNFYTDIDFNNTDLDTILAYTKSNDFKELCDIIGVERPSVSC